MILICLSILSVIYRNFHFFDVHVLVFLYVCTMIRLYLHRRISDQFARVVGRRLAVIGDELEREWAGQELHWPQVPLHMLRPARALTRIVYQ